MCHRRSVGRVGEEGRSKFMTSGYREDIDWLRAIAVLSVVAFHFETKGIYGGFVGVDIFFVISGFLITGIIQAEVARDDFSFARFYERRVRRLLPALYVMVAATAIPTFHYLLASERAEFFRSVAAVVTFTSNIFFWLQSGYFDHAAVEKPLLHTWSLAVEEQFYLALPLVMWVVLRLARGNRIVLPATLGALAVASFGLSVALMRSGASANAFFMSPPRAWEFLVGSFVALEGFPTLRHPMAQQIARGAALILMAIPILSLRPGPGFPGLNALLPCVGAAMFIWSGIGVKNQVHARYSPLHVVRFFGRISYSLYLWHWPLFTFARFAKSSLVLSAADTAGLFVLTVAVSYLSWRFVEQPFRSRTLAPTRTAAFRLGAAGTIVLLAASVGALGLDRMLPDRDRLAEKLDAYNAYDTTAVYRDGTCFSPADGVFGEACLGIAAGKTNVLLWGDSFAAHYFYGLNKLTDPSTTNIMQATQAACMPSFDADAQFHSTCRRFAAEMRTFLAGHKVELVIMSADWLEYGRSPRFGGMIADIRKTVAQLNAEGAPVVLLGPSVQFRTRLPSMLIRARLRGADARADDVVLPDIFAVDQAMHAALPASANFSYVSVVDAVCPERQCPLMVGEGVPLAIDHAHLTAEGSVHVMEQLLPMLEIGKQ
jgi:peptidoglycan/LPS O-acetylase OafA/YrhL